MLINRKIKVALFIILLLTGCASKPIVATGNRFITSAVPTDSKGQLYIYRTYDQFDEAVRDVFINNKKILTLPNSGYSTLNLEHGIYTIHSEVSGKKKNEPEIEFEILPGSINYIRLHILTNASSGSMSVIPIGGILTPTWDNASKTNKRWVFEKRNDPPPPIKGCRFVPLEGGVSISPK